MLDTGKAQKRLTFETMYRKSKLISIKDFKGVESELAHLNSFCDLSNSTAECWRFNLNQDVYLNRSMTFKNLLREIYCSAYQINCIEDEGDVCL